MNNKYLERKDEILKMVSEYIDDCQNNGKIPYIQDVHLMLNVHRTTIHDWREQHEEFDTLIERLKSLAEKRIIHGGLTNQLSTSMSIFLLKANYGYKETSKLELDGNINHKNNVVVLPEREIIDGELDDPGEE